MTPMIDDDFARFGAKSYAINKINSVNVRERRPHGTAGAVIAGIIAFFAFFAAIGSMGEPDRSPVGPLIVAIAFAGLAFWQWKRSKIREYLLFLMTSSSETQAFVTRDESEVMALREQVESAMLRHSRSGRG